MRVLGKTPTQHNYPQRILRMKIRTQAGERFTQNLPAGENCIYWGVMPIQQKGESQKKLRWGMSNKDSPGENNKGEVLAVTG